MSASVSLFFSNKYFKIKYLSFKNIHKDSILHLVVLPRSGIQILVTALTGETITLKVDPSDTTGKVEAKTQAEESIPQPAEIDLHQASPWKIVTFCSQHPERIHSAPDPVHSFPFLAFHKFHCTLLSMNVCPTPSPKKIF